ncbi:MAG: hypothetical protein ACO33A_07605 [Hyphomonas sp.]
MLSASRGDQMPDGCKRDLIHGIREAFDMHGLPIRLFVRQGKTPYAGKVGPDGPPRYKRPREWGRSVAGLRALESLARHR